MFATHTISHHHHHHHLSSPTNTLGHGFSPTKRKRKPAGTPDPDAEVVYLSPKTLMESDRYICEVCNLSFQREQNLQMHRRRHKLPWSLHKNTTTNNNEPPWHAAVRTIKKRVYVCPEPRCVHHDPAHALGDLVGIKKHYRRKHTNCKQWVCEKCCKGYAVLSDYKAHLKTCGTKGHSCDCGRVFSRVETFIEHQDSCKARRKESVVDGLQEPTKQAFLPSTTTSFMKPIFNLNNNVSLMEPQYYSECSRLISERTANAPQGSTIFPPLCKDSGENLNTSISHSLELRELFPIKKNELQTKNANTSNEDTIMQQVLRLRSESEEVMREAMEQKAEAAERRKQAKSIMELAKEDIAKASRIKEQALLTEIRNAQLLKDYCFSPSSTIDRHQRIITCKSCNCRKLINCEEFRGEMTQCGPSWIGKLFTNSE